MQSSLTNLNLATLEEDWLLQVPAHDRYSRKVPDAKLDLSEAKAALEVVEAEVKRSIRRNPSKYGIEQSRVTEAMVAEAMILSPKYQKALKAVNDAKHVVDVLEAALNTLDHRKRTLESLVSLFGMSYFAKPKVKDQYNTSVKAAERRASRPKGLRRKKRVKDEAK
jgi:hypothetical protein